MKKKRKDDLRRRGKYLKILLTMKLIFILLFCFTFESFAELRAQVTIEKTNATLEEVIWELKRTTGIVFMYSNEDVAGVKGISLNERNTDVKQILTKCLQNTDLGFMEANGTIVIRRETKNAAEPQQKVTEITGVVLDETKQTLPGVTVRLKGTLLGTTTSDEGRFKLMVPAGKNQTLVFSYIGMEPQELVLDGKTSLKIVMKTTVAEIGEVVVTGIFERPKESFTGSSATFTSKDLKMIGNANVIQSLKSLDPALILTESDMFGSDPNRLPDLDIRGKTSIVGLQNDYETDPNQPLFILDGFESDLRTIMDLNIDRVESVTILKDAASTAIYGSKAANGVVVVETKRPVMGQLKVTYNGNLGVSMPDLSVYNLMDAREKLEFERLAGRYKYISASSNPDMQVYYDELYNKRLAEVERGVDSYWLSEPVRTGVDQKHRLYLDGGDEQMRYGLGLTYGNTQGVMHGSGRQVVGGNIDLFYRKNKLSFNNKLSLDYTTSEDVTVPFSEFADANPYYRKRDENGEVKKILELSQDNAGKEYKVYNPLWNYEQENRKEGNDLKLTNNFGITWDILPSLKVRGRFGIVMSRNMDEKFVSPLHTKFEGTDPLLRGEYNETNERLFRYSGDASITYVKLLREVHQLNVVGGFDLSSSEKRKIGFSAVGFPDGFTSPSFASQYSPGGRPSYSETTVRSSSFFINGGYAYDNRYLMDFNYRRDGSSVFGVLERFTNTYSVGVAWNMHNESFIDKDKWLNLFKVRFSVGNPGNQNFASSQAITTYVFNNWMQNVFGVGNVVNKLGNPDLKWQQTWDYNTGVDMKFFNSRLSVVFDYYYRNTDPLIVNLEQPASTGVASILTNFGSQVNKGFTISSTYTLLQKQQLSWRANMTMRRNRSYYENIGNALDKYNKTNKSKNLQRYYDGASTTALWAVPSIGIDPMTGQEVFLTKGGDYTTTFSYDNEVELGDSAPKVEGVIGTTLNYKKLDINFVFRYRLGGDVFNNALYQKVENISSEGLKTNQDKRALYDRWTTPGQVAAFRSISLTSSTPMSGRFIQKENTFSGESISVAYTFSGAWLKKARISNLRVSGYMNDIFRLSTVKRERGIDYPFARSVSFALNVTF